MRTRLALSLAMMLGAAAFAKAQDVGDVPMERLAIRRRALNMLIRLAPRATPFPKRGRPIPRHQVSKTLQICLA
jgi:hypothetical protein